MKPIPKSNGLVLNNRPVDPPETQISSESYTYQLDNEIGRGGFGVVLLAFNTSNGKSVAVKRFPLKNIDEDNSQLIQQEIDVMKSLDHPNIVKYMDTIKTQHYLYIILEYMESGSLAQILKRLKSFTESLSVIYITQVLRGLAYLHSEGVMHRDIKCANILTNKEGLVKLADFGIAVKQSDAGKEVDLDSQPQGSPYWIAPEIIELTPPTPACDIWSVGCVVIELLTGSPPYFSLAPMAAMYRILNDDYPPLPEGISQALRAFLLLCFQKEPGMRSSAEKLLEHPWLHNPPTNTNIVNSSNQLLSSPADVSAVDADNIMNTIRLHIKELSPAVQLNSSSSNKTSGALGNRDASTSSSSDKTLKSAKRSRSNEGNDGHANALPLRSNDSNKDSEMIRKGRHNRSQHVDMNNFSQNLFADKIERSNTSIEASFNPKSTDSDNTKQQSKTRSQNSAESGKVNRIGSLDTNEVNGRNSNKIPNGMRRMSLQTTNTPSSTNQQLMNNSVDDDRTIDRSASKNINDAHKSANPTRNASPAVNRVPSLNSISGGRDSNSDLQQLASKFDSMGIRCPTTTSSPSLPSCSPTFSDAPTESSNIDNPSFVTPNKISLAFTNGIAELGGNAHSFFQEMNMQLIGKSRDSRESYESAFQDKDLFNQDQPRDNASSRPPYQMNVGISNERNTKDTVLGDDDDEDDWDAELSNNAMTVSMDSNDTKDNNIVRRPYKMSEPISEDIPPRPISRSAKNFAQINEVGNSFISSPSIDIHSGLHSSSSSNNSHEDNPVKIDNSFSFTEINDRLTKQPAMVQDTQTIMHHLSKSKDSETYGTSFARKKNSTTDSSSSHGYSKNSLQRSNSVRSAKHRSSLETKDHGLIDQLEGLQREHVRRPSYVFSSHTSFLLNKYQEDPTTADDDNYDDLFFDSTVKSKEEDFDNAVIDSKNSISGGTPSGGKHRRNISWHALNRVQSQLSTIEDEDVVDDDDIGLDLDADDLPYPKKPSNLSAFKSHFMELGPETADDDYDDLIDDGDVLQLENLKESTRSIGRGKEKKLIKTRSANIRKLQEFSSFDHQDVNTDLQDFDNEEFCDRNDLAVKLLHHLRRKTIDPVVVEEEDEFLKDQFDEGDFKQNEMKDENIRRSREVLQIMSKIRPETKESVVIALCNQLISIFEETPEQRELLVTYHGMMPIIDMFEARLLNESRMNYNLGGTSSTSNWGGGANNTKIRPHVLRVINKLIEDNTRVQEQISLVGLIPTIMNLFEKSCQTSRFAKLRSVSEPNRTFLSTSASNQNLETVEKLGVSTFSFINSPMATVPSMANFVSSASTAYSNAPIACEVDPVTLEAAKFIHQISSTSSLTLQMLIGAGGLSVLTNMVSFGAFIVKNSATTPQGSTGSQVLPTGYFQGVGPSPLDSSTNATAVRFSGFDDNLDQKRRHQAFTFSTADCNKNGLGLVDQNNKYIGLPERNFSEESEQIEDTDLENLMKLNSTGDESMSDLVTPKSMTTNYEDENQSNSRLIAQSNLSAESYDSNPSSMAMQSAPQAVQPSDSELGDCMSIFVKGIDCIVQVFSVQSARTRDFCRLFVKLGLLPHLSIGFQNMLLLYQNKINAVNANVAATAGFTNVESPSDQSSQEFHSMASFTHNFSFLIHRRNDSVPNHALDISGIESGSVKQVMPGSSFMISSSINAMKDLASSNAPSASHKRNESTTSMPSQGTRGTADNAVGYHETDGSDERKYCKLIATLMFKFSRSDGVVAETMARVDYGVINAIISALKAPELRKSETALISLSALALPYESPVANRPSPGDRRKSSFSNTSYPSNGAMLLPAYVEIMELLLKCLKNLSNEPFTLDDLERAGTLETLIPLLEGPVSDKFIYSILPCIFNMCRLNKPRQNQAALLGIIPHLKYVINSGAVLKQLALQMLFDMAHASAATREELWKNDCVSFYLNLLNSDVSSLYWQTSDLGALKEWMNADPVRVSTILVEKDNLSKLIDFFKLSTHHAQNINLLAEMLSRSKLLSTALARSPTFIQSMMKKLQASKDPYLLRGLMRILTIAHNSHPNPREFVTEHNLYEFMEGFTKSEQVLVSQSAMKLLKEFQHLNTFSEIEK